MATTFVGTVDNTGTIQLTPGDTIVVGDASTSDATLIGSGTVELVDSTAINPFAPDSTLTNENNLIEGGGAAATPAAINVVLVNGASGTVSAVGNDGASEVVLALNADVTNDGGLSATHAGTLKVNGITIDNSGGGTISATDAGSEVLVTGGATILGGTLTSDVDADIRLADGVLDGSDGHAVENGGDIVIGAGETGTLVGTIDNFGAITLESPGATLAIGSSAETTATLQGFGLVQLGASTSIVAGTTGAILVNTDNQIEASGGTIGGTDGALISVAIDNEFGGWIFVQGDGAGHGQLVLTGDITNAGLLDAEGGGRLVLSGVTVDGSSGGGIGAGIFCSCDPSEVLIENSTILGGALVTGPDSVIKVTDSVLQGTDDVGAVLIDGHIEVLGGHSMTLAGTIVNTWDITLEPAATVIIDDAGPVTLTGGGLVVLDSSSVIEGAGVGARLDNVDNAIIATGGDVAAGTGGNTISVDLVNIEHGAVGAAGDGAGHGLLSLSGATTNLGLLFAEDGGKLVIEGPLHNFGEVVADSAAVVAKAAVSGAAGQFFLTGNAEFDISATVDGIVSFAGDGGTVVLAHNDDFIGVWSGTAGTFFLNETPPPPSGHTYSLQYDANTTGTGGLLTLKDGATDLWSVRVAGKYDVNDFTLGDGGKLIRGQTVTASEWQSGVSGAWLNASRWTNGVPGVWSQAVLDAGTYFVRTTTDQTVYGISTGLGAVLDVAAGAFWTNGGTGTGSNDGTILVRAGASFNVAGNFHNHGLLKVLGVDATLGLHATHIDGGSIRLSAGSILEASVFASVLNDVSVIGQNNAAGSSVIQAALGGSLSILGSEIVSSTLSAADAAGDGTSGASSIAFGDTNVQNALLTGGGAFRTLAFTDALFQNVTVGSGATFDVVGDSILTLRGLLTNQGTVEVGAAGSPASIALSGNVRLSGGGTLFLNDSTIDSCGCEPWRLVNDSNIVGSGRIGDADMSLINNGLISAGDHSTLTIGCALLNNGKLSTADHGSLDLAAVSNAGTIINEASGTISQTGALLNRPTGTVANHGRYDVHAAVANYGLVHSFEGAFDVDGAFSNLGSITVDAGSFEVDGRTGNAGTITTGTTSDVVLGDLLINAANGVVTNTGACAVNSNVSNKGLIETQGGTFTISGSVANRASLEAENGASFTIGGTLDNRGGSLTVDDDSSMFVQSRALGGSASLMNGGTLEFGAASSVDVSFADDANVLVLDQSTKFGGDLADFTTGNLVAFMDMASSDQIHFSYAANAGDTAGVLSVFDTTAHLTARIHIDGAGYTTADFLASSYASSVDGSSRFAILSQHAIV
jgi:hypothetical protein